MIISYRICGEALPPAQFCSMLTSIVSKKARSCSPLGYSERSSLVSIAKCWLHSCLRCAWSKRSRSCPYPSIKARVVRNSSDCGSESTSRFASGVVSPFTTCACHDTERISSMKTSGLMPLAWTTPLIFSNVLTNSFVQVSWVPFIGYRRHPWRNLAASTAIFALVCLSRLIVASMTLLRMADTAMDRTWNFSMEIFLPFDVVVCPSVFIIPLSTSNGVYAYFQEASWLSSESPNSTTTSLYSMGLLGSTAHNSERMRIACPGCWWSARSSLLPSSHKHSQARGRYSKLYAACLMRLGRLRRNAPSRIRCSANSSVRPGW